MLTFPADDRALITNSIKRETPQGKPVASKTVLLLSCSHERESPRRKAVASNLLLQKFKRSANCITRGSPASVVIVPTFELLIVLLGRPKFAWFSALNTSQRKSK